MGSRAHGSAAPNTQRQRGSTNGINTGGIPHAKPSNTHQPDGTRAGNHNRWARAAGGAARVSRQSAAASTRVAEYGCDTPVYRLTNPAARAGVVFYAKQAIARRGFELGMLALREFHQRQPGQEIHISVICRRQCRFR